MSERTRNVIVGITALVGLIGLAGLILIFGEVPGWMTDSYLVTIRLDDAAGLSRGSRVKYNGVDIGYLESITLRDDVQQGVHLRARLQSRYTLPANAQVHVVRGLLGGSAQINLTPGPPTTDTLPRNGTGMLEGNTSSMEQRIVNLAERLEQGLNQRLGKFEDIAKKFGAMAEQFTAVGEKLNVLLVQRSPQQVDDGEGPANLVSVIARADARLAEMKQTLAHINALIGDPQIGDDLRATLANARQLTQTAHQRLEQLTGRFIDAADQLSTTLSQADALLREAREGEGTLGRLLSDPALYNALEDAAHRLSDALREAKLLMMKWKAEGLPVQF